MQSAKTPDGEGPEGSSARATARARLSRLRTLEDPLRGELLRDLAARREGLDGRHIVLERRNKEVVASAPEELRDRPDYLILPMASSLSSSSRASERWGTYATAWERAAREYRRGVVLTLTTDPSRFESLLEATESLYADLNRLRSWLAYDPESGPSRPGYRPASVASIEFTDSGLPHLHVAFFGVSWLTKQESLSRYCSENLDRCSVVWLDRIWREGSPESGRWRWERDPDAPTEGRSPKEYLGESMAVRRRVCELSTDEIKRAASALLAHGLEGPDPEELGLELLRERDLERGRELWKAALYFATEVRYYTLSPALREDPDETLPHVPRWERVQIGVYEEIPGYVIDAAHVVARSRPPPWETDRLRDAGLSSGSAGGGSA
jgi:hypothetical protein